MWTKMGPVWLLKAPPPPPPGPQITNDVNVFTYEKTYYPLFSLYLLYIFHINFDPYDLWDTTPWKVCDIDLIFKGYPRSQMKYHNIYDFVYVLHANIDHSLHHFWDIGLNR